MAIVPKEPDYDELARNMAEFLEGASLAV